MKIIAIEGISGAGKSTASPQLQEELTRMGVKVLVSGGIQTTKEVNPITEILRQRLKEDRFLRLEWKMETSLLIMEMWLRVMELDSKDADLVLYENYVPSIWAFQLARASEEKVSRESAIGFMRELEKGLSLPAPLGVIEVIAPGADLQDRLLKRGDTSAVYEAREDALQKQIADEYEYLQKSWYPWVRMENTPNKIKEVAEMMYVWAKGHERSTVYIAGPLFTPAERDYLEEIARRVERLGVDTYLPHRDAGLTEPGEKMTAPYFDADREGLDKAQLVIAVLDGFDVDAGTAWEIGYANSRGIPCVGVIKDTRILDPASQVNLMIYNSCTVVSDEELCQQVIALHRNLSGEQST